VPGYEQDFLWDHSDALREGRGRKTQRQDDRAKSGNERREEPGKDWLLRMWESFKATPKKTGRKTPDYFDYKRYEKGEEDTRGKEGKRWQERREREREQVIARDRDSDRDKKRERRLKPVYSEDEDEDEDACSPRTTKRSGTTPKPTPFYEVRRTIPTSARSFERLPTASTESIRSAPNLEEVTRLRQQSRTLTGDRAPKRRASAEHARTRSSEHETERPRRQASAESIPRSRRDRTGDMSPPRMSRPQPYYVYDSAHERHYTPGAADTQNSKEGIKYAIPEVEESPGYTQDNVSYGRTDAHRFGQEPLKSSKGNYTTS
jgi:hypothetical protein